MREVLHHAMWAVAVLAVAQAARRIASRLAPGGLERALATVVIAVTIAVVEALALGLVGLGASPVALLVAALATAGAATARLPVPDVRPTRELAAWWGERALRERLAAASVAGAGLAWVAWQVRHPAIGFDSEVYHYGQVAGWIANGRPGSSLTLSYDIPYTNYPQTDEVALTWGAGLARSWIPIALWNPFMLVTLAVASVATLRTLRVPPAIGILATAALLATPLVVRQLNEPQTDLPCLTWVACAAALALRARAQPLLLLPAVLAGGLAIGTKTTAAPEVLAVLVVGAVLGRRHLRSMAPALGLAAALAIVVGGLWYVRNLVQHGSPLWPFAQGPFGDPRPAFLNLVNRSFAQHPLATLDGRLGAYVTRLGGSWLLLPGTLAALVAAALGRRWDPTLRRSVLVAGGLATAATLIWSTAWGTGLQTSPLLGSLAGWPLSAVRYLLPALALAATAVALAATVRGAVGWGARALLVAALAWSLILDAGLGTPSTPSLRVLAAGAVAGLAGLGALSAAARAARTGVAPAPRWLQGPAAVLVVAVVGVGAAAASDGYVKRFTAVESSTSFGHEALAWHLSQPGFADGSRPVVFASRAVLAPYAGDHFTHPLSLMPADVTCAAFDRTAAEAYVVVTPPSFWAGVLGIEPYGADRCAARRKPAYAGAPFTVFASRPGAVRPSVPIR